MDKVVFALLPLLLIAVIVNSQSLAKQYFLTIDFTTLRHSGINLQENLRAINDNLCSPNINVSPSVSCYLKFKVVGEPRVIVVVDVTDSSEFESRMAALMRSCNIRYESEPLVEYGDFARFLGINETLIQLDNNMLENVPEVLWCEFNINFGDKTASETLAIWKQEAELVLQTRNSGVPIEIFKLLGERTVHLLVHLNATMFDLLLFSTPFNQAIPNTLKTTCKIVVKA